MNITIDELRVRVMVLEIELKLMRPNYPGRSTMVRELAELRRQLRCRLGSHQPSLF